MKQECAEPVCSTPPRPRHAPAKQQQQHRPRHASVKRQEPTDNNNKLNIANKNKKKKVNINNFMEKKNNVNNYNNTGEISSLFDNLICTNNFLHAS